MAGSMDGRVGFVTGGGSGMGRETALRLAAAGASVAIADRNENGARETAAVIEAAGGKASPIALDVSDPAAVNVAAARSALGPIDAAVNIAGIYQVVEVQDIADDDWAAMFAVHVTGTFNVCRAAPPDMIAARSGAIAAGQKSLRTVWVNGLDFGPKSNRNRAGNSGRDRRRGARGCRGDGKPDGSPGRPDPPSGVAWRRRRT